LNTNSSAITGIGYKHDNPIKERLESTTSYFSDEDEAVREFAYGKIKNDFDGMGDMMETPARSMI
jgi:hypothetical protein